MEQCARTWPELTLLLWHIYREISSFKGKGHLGNCFIFTADVAGCQAFKPSSDLLSHDDGLSVFVIIK